MMSIKLGISLVTISTCELVTFGLSADGHSHRNMVLVRHVPRVGIRL